MTKADKQDKRYAVCETSNPARNWIRTTLPDGTVYDRPEILRVFARTDDEDEAIDLAARVQPSDFDHGINVWDDKMEDFVPMPEEY